MKRENKLRVWSAAFILVSLAGVGFIDTIPVLSYCLIIPGAVGSLAFYFWALIVERRTRVE